MRHWKIGITYDYGKTVEHVEMIGKLSDAVQFAANLTNKNPTALIIETKCSHVSDETIAAIRGECEA